MKITCLRFLFTGLLACLLSTVVFGQAVGHIENEDPEGPLPSEGCEYKIRFAVMVANLSSPNGQNIYELPSGYPDIYVQYNLDGFISGTEQISTFSFDKDFTDSINNGINYFSGTILIDGVDFYAHCAAANEEGNIYLPYTMELQTATGNPYPICLYTYHGDIFACDAFDVTAPYCEDQISLPGGGGGPSCNSADLVSISGNIEIACRSCAPEGSGIGDDRNATLDEKEAFREVTITPNPFQETIQVFWSMEESVTKISLFDASGRLVESRQLSEQNENIHLETTHLPSGLYFLQVSNEASSKMFKLIKQ